MSRHPWSVLCLSCLGLATLAPPAAAAAPAVPLARQLELEVERIGAEILAVRHQIHQNPELSNRETATAALVAERLRGLGLEVRTGIAKTGVVGILEGGKPGPVVAVRADMDALPVTEDTDLPFKSTRKATLDGREVGVAHACGHDIHTSVQLGVAAALAPLKADLPGTVVFIFQPAEEGPPLGEEGGAPLMVDEGVLANPRPAAIFALHADPELPVGQVGYTEGPTWAAVDQFTIRIKGKQSHGAYPHLGVDPVVIAAQAILALQTIRSRTLPALAPSVLSIGIVRGGERFNILPGEVYLEGTVRTFDETVRATIERRMREILDGITKAGGGSFDLQYQKNAPATINDTPLAKATRPSLEATVGKENVIVQPPTMGGEDFAYFANLIPGFYFRLGTTLPQTTSGGLHTPNFRADDQAVPVGIRAMAHLLLDYLVRNSPPAR
jgi:amidohydrolase